ncbi:protein PLASTID REDOX INSENSITIVE 2, partial [Phalaenopsis equestris]|uniref:protein PLASTID REDOX INSENSITIVE 2 n=1 Tax=Phalaenopsis equestris TaxID=78828 RepID=UPI0009E5D240
SAFCSLSFAVSPSFAALCFLLLPSLLATLSPPSSLSQLLSHCKTSSRLPSQTINSTPLLNPHLLQGSGIRFSGPDSRAEAETSKFRAHLIERLSKKDIFDDSLEEIVCICTEILSDFLHTEYGGPGTLMVVPFIDMADTINEKGLPGGPQAARAAVLWAQEHIDKDWKDWTGDPNL